MDDEKKSRSAEDITKDGELMRRLEADLREKMGKDEPERPFIRGRSISHDLSIKMYLHCGLCLRDRPPGISAREWAQLEIGYTDLGFQVWCRRHECNVMHVDFEGQLHPADTSRHRFKGEFDA